MATFVLIHGAWHGSWCWKRVRAGLRSLGHDVFTPTLTGLGERSHLLSQAVTVETHIADIVNLLRWEELSEVILVAHSYGGFVGGHVVDRHADRLSHMVYLDAFVPEDGQTAGHHAPEFAAMLRAQAEGVGDGWRMPPVPSFMFDVNPADATWVDAQCTEQPLVTMETPARIENGEDVVPTSYILATGFAGSPFGLFAERAAARGWNRHNLPGGHDLMLDCPAELTMLLSDIGSIAV